MTDTPDRRDMPPGDPNLPDGERHADGDQVDPGWPWSFLLLVAAGAAYLIFRFVELGIKLFT